ncbi:VOC family protein [Roseomonas nepalensis]|uniref:VOC family protein n=1 Tax=Muricoccus nepalensis TaxID=1854500 RepID=A0A502G8W4_9PROT|nr:VOC family protein [Roseomonas nepalensis]TPG58072.1 VOC family protein [Roseomonas nepalensis]
MRSASGLDHVGVLSRDALALWGAYERLGFALTPVAQQSGANGPLGTANRCAMLRSGYIELLAIVDPALPDNGAGAMLDRMAGALILALGMDDAEGNLARLRRAGIDLPGVLPLSRAVEPGGPIARFKRLPLPAAPEGRVQLVRHLTPELLWREDWMRHPNGARALRAAIIVSDAPAASAARLSRLAGLPLEPDPAGGFALPLPDGARVRIMGPEEAAALLPGLEAPALPAVMAMVIGVDSLEATRRALSAVPHAEVPGGVMVAAREAAGCALLFEA